LEKLKIRGSNPLKKITMLFSAAILEMFHNYQNSQLTSIKAGIGDSLLKHPSLFSVRRPVSSSSLIAQAKPLLYIFVLFVGVCILTGCTFVQKNKSHAIGST